MSEMHAVVTNDAGFISSDLARRLARENKGGSSISINELAKLIIDSNDKDMEIIYKGPRSSDIKHSSVNISKIEKYGLEYSPEDGLKKTFEWFTKEGVGK